MEFTILEDGVKKEPFDYICVAWTSSSRRAKDMVKIQTGKPASGEEECRVYIDSADRLVDKYIPDRGAKACSSLSDVTLAELKEKQKVLAKFYDDLISRSVFGRYYKQDEDGRWYIPIDLTGNFYAKNCMLAALNRYEYEAFMPLIAYLYELYHSRIDVDPTVALAAFTVWRRSESNHGIFETPNLWEGGFKEGGSAWKILHRILEEGTGDKKPKDVASEITGKYIMLYPKRVEFNYQKRTIQECVDFLTK